MTDAINNISVRTILGSDHLTVIVPQYNKGTNQSKLIVPILLNA